MTLQEKIDAINENPIGAKVTYWPSLNENGGISHKNGKRTKIKHPAFLSNSGSPVIFLENISGYVHVDHVVVVSLMNVDIDSPCFDKQFDHLWE